METSIHNIDFRVFILPFQSPENQNTMLFGQGVCLKWGCVCFVCLANSSKGGCVDCVLKRKDEGGLGKGGGERTPASSLPSHCPAALDRPSISASGSGSVLKVLPDGPPCSQNPGKSGMVPKLHAFG